LSPTSYSTDDLGRHFDAPMLRRGRSIILLGHVDVALEGKMITGSVDYQGTHHAASLTPAMENGEVAFASRCTCRKPGCEHRVAIGLMALEKFPKLRRKAEAPAAAEAAPALPPRKRLKLEVAPADPSHAFIVATLLKVEATGLTALATPYEVEHYPNIMQSARDLARMIGGGHEQRTAIGPKAAAAVLEALAQSGVAFWQPTGKRLKMGDERIAEPDLPLLLPEHPVCSREIRPHAGAPASAAAAAGRCPAWPRSASRRPRSGFSRRCCG
jgi:hypothetical protein